jgi:hypothetical protein
MSKPIFIARIPINIDIKNIMDGLKNLDNLLNDYHFIPLRDSSVEKVEFECYNSPHTEIEFEELKKMVMEKLNTEV